MEGVRREMFCISYSRKVRTAPFEMMEIGCWEEFDKPQWFGREDEAFRRVVERVERWIEERRNEIVEKSVRRPEKKEREQVE